MSDASAASAPETSNAHNTRIDVVLFDIGGVLANFAGLAMLRQLAGIPSELDAATRWLTSPWVRRFESGQCSDEEFAIGVIAELGLPFATPDEFLQRFVSWLSDPYDGAEQMIRDTSEHALVGCLSNTNALQWRRIISHWPLTPLFEHRFLSFELGAVKPDREIYDLVTNRLPVPPDRVLFIDDNPLNVEGALAAGLRAEQALGVAEARAVLARHALLG